jgi:4-amino-4-deoxy-L-arabinose transferase-like glycosyltransferase
MALIDQATRRRDGLRRPQLRSPLGLVALLALAAANFGWQLGSSSYYVDEVLSLNTSQTPLGGLLGVVEARQLSPPGFYLFQHEWLYRVNDHLEWVARLPSLVCGVALVAAIYWLAGLVSQRRAVAVGAAALAAVSPFLLEFSQLAQNYVFTSLGVTVAVAAALSAERSRNHRTAWLVASLLAAGLALCLHYTAALVLAPLCVRIAINPLFALRERVTFVGMCAAVQAALIPIIVAQQNANGGRADVANAADLSFTSASRVIAGPFAGRVDPLRAVGVAVVLISLLGLLIRRVRGRSVPGRSGSAFVAAVAFGEPLALLVLSGFGARLALGRYAAVAVPMLVIAIAMAVAALPRPAALPLALAAVVVSALGLIDSHRTSGFYADARGVIRYVGSTRHAGDAVLTPDSPGITLPLRQYADLLSTPPIPVAVLGSAEAATFGARHRRLWIVSDLTGLHITIGTLFSYEQGVAQQIGYRSLRPRIFSSVVPLAVALWVPRQVTRRASR